MALAFDLPQHLPRGSQAQDRSTHILTKVGQATNQSLNAALAASWLAELDSTIHDTKARISNRIHDDLPAFERQLESSISIQARSRDLSSNVDHLAQSLNDSKMGIIPTLLRALSSHETLVEQANDSDITHRALTHLLRIRDELNTLSDRVQKGELPESAQACGRVQTLVTETPSPLDRVEIMGDIKKRYRTFNDRVQEQLGDAYARSILFSSSADTISLTIQAFTTVPPTSTQITLHDILCSLTSDFLTARLSTFRRDIISRFVDPTLLFSRSLTASTSDSSCTLSLSSGPPSLSPLHSLQTLITFLNSHIFAYLPPAHVSFPSTFYAPITSAVLTHLLKPSIPSSLGSLPSFLGTVDEAVHFEESLLPAEARDRPIRHWANDVAGHYEKRRRECILQYAREVVERPEDGATIKIEVAVKRSSALPAHSGQEETDGTGWDFDVNNFDLAVDASGSGSPRSRNGASNANSPIKDRRDHGANTQGGEDVSDGWGWGDDTDVDPDAVPEQPSPLKPKPVVPTSEDNDDPWGDDGWDSQPAPTAPPEPDRSLEAKPEQSAPKRAPKMAKRLEKFSAKAKGLSASNTPVSSPVVASAPVPPPPKPLSVNTSRPPPPPPAPKMKKAPKKEIYFVSVRARTVWEIAESLMREGQELMQSNVFVEHVPTKTTAPGKLLVAAAPSVLDLHRALYPVAHSSVLAREADLAMRWSNDCRFLSDEVAKIRNRGEPILAEEKWAETEDRLKMLGEAWFEDVVVRQQDAVRNILVGAQGFTEVAKMERFEECRSAIEQVLQEITYVARQWKSTLTNSAYLHATGQIVDDALFRVMDDVLSLEDIPEADSERLSDLCEMLAPLEELFVDIPGEPSVVGSYVPLWFKFSYLSWLIKGSIADLSYLFDQGMLVDYEIDELVRLLRALFAETPLRENTIAKISKGHPVTAQGDDY